MASPALVPQRAAGMLARLEANVQRVIVGKSATVRLAAAGLVAGGHVLLQDLPGTGKTMLARSIAASIGGEFKRVQCTPDLFDFVPGPVFTNVLLADEVNRSTPRTQAALLEAMAEAQVTVEGVTHPLPSPFFVIATQNPHEFHGTYPLPEAQLDRFLVACEMGPPSAAEAEEILASRQHGDPITELAAVLTSADVVELQQACLQVVVAGTIRSYIVSLLAAVRSRPEVALPASMRAGLYLQRAAQALALFDQRDFVLPDDVKTLVGPVLAHRLGMRGRASAAEILEQVLAELPLPPLRSR